MAPVVITRVQVAGIRRAGALIKVPIDLMVITIVHTADPMASRGAPAVVTAAGTAAVRAHRVDRQQRPSAKCPTIANM